MKCDSVVEEVHAGNVGTCERHSDEVFAVGRAVNVCIADCAGGICLHNEICTIWLNGESVASIAGGHIRRHEFIWRRDAVPIHVAEKCNRDVGDRQIACVECIIIGGRVFKHRAADKMESRRRKCVSVDSRADAVVRDGVYDARIGALGLRVACWNLPDKISGRFIHIGACCAGRHGGGPVSIDVGRHGLFVGV